VLLADEMGLGKTIQAIGALRLLLRHGEPGPALVVVPTGLVLQWRRQFREWAPELTLSTCIGGPEERRQRWLAPSAFCSPATMACCVRSALSTISRNRAWMKSRSGEFWGRTRGNY